MFPCFNPFTDNVYGVKGGCHADYADFKTTTGKEELWEEMDLDPNCGGYKTKGQRANANVIRMSPAPRAT